MKKNLLLVCLLSFIGCNNEGKNEQQILREKYPSNLTTFIKDLIGNFKNDNFSELDKTISSNNEFFLLSSGLGVYNDIESFSDYKTFYENQLSLNEFEDNPFKYFLDFLFNVELNELEIVPANLYDFQICDYHEEGFTLDTTQANSRILTEIYTTNINRDDILPIDKEKIIKLGNTQDNSTIRLFINDGKQTIILYFLKEEQKYKLSIIDMRDCG